MLSNIALANTYYCEVKGSGIPATWPKEFLRAETVGLSVRSIDFIFHVPESDGSFKSENESIFQTVFRFGYEVTNCSTNLNYVSETTGLLMMSSRCLMKGTKNKLKFDVELSPDHEGSATLEIKFENTEDILSRSIHVLTCKVDGL